MSKEEYKITANVHVHATHEHMTPPNYSHDHGTGTMVVIAHRRIPHHHCDDKCIAALEAEVERLTNLVTLLASDGKPWSDVKAELGL